MASAIIKVIGEPPMWAGSGQVSGTDEINDL